jgi:hypothetical protein
MSKKKTNPSLRRFYAQGKRALDYYRRMKRQGESIYGALPRRGVQTLSEKNRLFEARRFAKLYEGPQLEWICGLGQKRGRPLTKTHVLQLIRVPSRTDRNRLAKKCAEEEWRSGRLELEIARMLPGRRYSGAPHKVPASVDRMLVITERQLRDLVRWVNVLSSTTNKTGHSALNRLPGRVPQLLRKISKEAERLEKLCATKRGRPPKPPSKHI